MDYGQQKPFIPSLFIGYVRWPFDWDYTFEHDGPAYLQARSDTEVPVKLELPEMITVTQHQTAGHMCHQLKLFGVFFHLNDLDLYQAAKRHGHEDMMAPASWRELVDWQTALRQFGLHLEGTEHQYMQEAFVPFGGECAWEYAKRKNLHVLLPTGGRGEKCKKAFPTWDTLHAYLHDAYEIARVWRPEGRNDTLASITGCIYGPPCGAIVYENCD